MPEAPVGPALPNPKILQTRIRHVAHIHNYVGSPGPSLTTHPVLLSQTPSGGSGFYSEVALNNSYWNNQLESQVARLYESNRNRRHTISNLRTSDLVQNDINRRLTLESSSSSKRELRLSRRIINVSASRDLDLVELSREEQNRILQSDLSFISSHLSLDLLNMGKIQEFRDKVSVTQVKMPRKDIWRCLGAEFLGTFLLVLIGCGSTIQLEGENTSKPTLLGVALCFGLLVASLVETIGHVSGCHINPAVTLAMLVTGKIQLVKALLYVVVQCVAAIVGIGVLKALTPDPNEDLTFGYLGIADRLSTLQGFGIEFMLTFVLLFMIFAVTDEHRTDLKGSAPVAIGLCLSALILYGGPLTGAGLNPARVLGPCVILGRFENHWIYWFGPLGGAVTAAAVYQHIFRALRPDEVVAAEIAMENKAREREATKENGGVAPPV